MLFFVLRVGSFVYFLYALRLFAVLYISFAYQKKKKITEVKCIKVFLEDYHLGKIVCIFLVFQTTYSINLSYTLLFDPFKEVCKKSSTTTIIILLHFPTR